MRAEADAQMLPRPSPHHPESFPTHFSYGPNLKDIAPPPRAQPRPRPRLLVVTYTLGPALDSCPFSPSPSKLSRQSATEIPLPMLPLADTEKLIREKDEEVSKRLASLPTSVPSPL